MLTFTDDQFKADIQAELGIKPEWAAEALATSTRTSSNRWPASRPVRFIPRKESVRWFVYDVKTGTLREVQ